MTFTIIIKMVIAKLVDESLKKWKKVYEVVDDITAIVIHLTDN